MRQLAAVSFTLGALFADADDLEMFNRIFDTAQRIVPKSTLRKSIVADRARMAEWPIKANADVAPRIRTHRSAAPLAWIACARVLIG